MSAILTALSLLTDSAILRSIYLLRPDLRGTQVEPDEFHAGRFLAWIAATGRKQYFGIKFDREFYSFLTEPIDGYLSRLEWFASQGLGQRAGVKIASLDDLHFWYYAYGIPEFNLELFVTKRELQALAAHIIASDPEGVQLSQLDTILHAAAGDAAAKLRSPYQTRPPCLQKSRSLSSYAALGALA